MKLLPARRPQISQAEETGVVGAAVRPVHCRYSARSASSIGSANNAFKNAIHAAQVVGSRNQRANNFSFPIASMIVGTKFACGAAPFRPLPPPVDARVMR